MNKRSSSDSSSENDGRSVPQTLDGKYTIVRNFGGTIETMAHLAVDNVSSEQLVVKIGQKGEKEELEREFDFLHSLEHPNLIKPYMFVSEANLSFEDNKKEISPKLGDDMLDQMSCSYFTLKFYENGDLFENVNRDGPMTEAIARYYFYQLINVVEYLHLKNIVHRDIKLDNILLDDTFQLMLIDFGFAEEIKSKSFAKSDEFEATQAMGTTGYISPEQLVNDQLEPF